ncbi:MAG: DUF5615 family PIN-like protein [Deltaproteobacteria bacterium]|nr:DUF5615 family PIN-like protein [Deltaproteobacteria bacterium]
MLVRVDAQLPPVLAQWLEKVPGLRASHVVDLGLLGADDREVFEKARLAKAVVVTKDLDFVKLVDRLGSPPQIVWVTCGNLDNRRLADLIARTWQKACELLRAGEPLVEISEDPRGLAGS